MVRVLITRPEPGATRTLKALDVRGINATCLPLTEILPLEFETPTGNFDAIIITSQNAISHGAALLRQFMALPVFVVGRRTADSLEGHTIAAWAETADALLPQINTTAPKRLLYICGQTRRPELEWGLKAAGNYVEAVEVYEAKPIESAPEALRRFFQIAQSTIVLLHAPSAVHALVSAINPRDIPETTQFLCLSAAIAAQLPPEWSNHIAIAERPDEASMLNQLDKLLAQDHMAKA